MTKLSNFYWFCELQNLFYNFLGDVHVVITYSSSICMKFTTHFETRGEPRSLTQFNEFFLMYS